MKRLLASATRATFRIVQWSVQVDHLHLVLEADDARTLSRGMASLNCRLAKSVNRLAMRKGAVLRERYHAHQLATPREVHRALGYVLNNAHHHRLLTAGVDPMSSGPMFDGWANAPHERATRDASVAEPRTWLLRIGWRRHGALRVPNEPAPKKWPDR